MAAGVTNRRLVSFPRFMRLLRVLVVVPLWLLLTAEGPSPNPTPNPDSTPSAAASDNPSPSPSPQPTPVNAFLSLDVTAGTVDTVINVSGGQFLPNQQLNLYWDAPAKVAGAATADANGSFNTRVKPNPSDKPGVHKLCASVLPNPCANFTLQAPTPTPSPSPSPEASPSPSASPSAEATPTQVATAARVSSNLTGFDVISRPPFVFLPIFGIGFLIVALGYWAITALRRPRSLAPMPAAAVVHRATRPDYSASFGAPPPRPTSPAQQSAWNEQMPAQDPRPYSPPPQAPEPPAAQTNAPAYQWGLGEPDTGYPDLRSSEQRFQDAGREPE